MANSKKRKRTKQRRSQTFYEAIPMAITPPVAIPEMREHFSESLVVINESRLKLASHLQAFHWPTNWQLTPAQRERLKTTWHQVLIIAKRTAQKVKVVTLATGLATTDSLLRHTQSAAYSLKLTTQTAIDYAPAITADLRSYGARALRAAFGRRARLTYLVLSVVGIVSLAATGAVIATATINSYANDISSPAALLAKKKTGTTILDRNGKVLFEGYGAQSEQPAKLSELPQTLKDATLSAEDPTFYDHPGFSWRGTTRAAWVDLTHGARVEGGSTLTQQLVKNALLTSHKNFQRKYQELLLSMELERRYSKDQILEMYFNEIYYGQGSSGIEAASVTYFHKSARDLTLAESALLAGLPLGPSRFDPNIDVEAATGRRNYVLARMAELGKISKEAAASAKAQPIQLASVSTATSDSDGPMMVYAKKVNIQAPHFVFYVLDQLRKLYGDDIVEQGGITVRTTLDIDKQRIAEETVAGRINALAEHHVTNGGLISLSPTTGDILAMVGSVDYNAPGFGNVNVILSQLQPGSSFKPIAYATAFKKGYTGATHVDDAPMDLPNGDGSRYVPQNYDLKFRGSVSLRQALGNSLNIPAIKVLQHAGISDTIKTAHDMGITSLQDESRFGLALVLGGGEVRPIDMATVYGTFANSGTKVPPRAVLGVTDRHGKDVTKAAPAGPKEALDSRIAYMITNILSDNSARTEEFGPNSPLKLSRPAAAKTGTTNDFRDNWTVGYTPQVVTAVWVGNNDHSAMNNVDGITGAAPIWHDYMEAVHRDLPVVDFTTPAGVSSTKVCTGDGGLVNPWDAGYTEIFMSDNVPTKQCSSQPKPKDENKPDSGQTPPIMPDFPVNDGPFGIRRIFPTNPIN